MRIKCYCNLYVSQSLEKLKLQHINDLMEGNLKHSIHILTLSQGEQNHLEFYAASLLRQHIYDDAEIFVVGLAGKYEEAAALTETIVQDVLDKTNNTNIRNYILQQQKVFEEGRV